MKNNFRKILSVGLLAAFTCGTLTTSCSKSDDQQDSQPPKEGVIDVAVGTYKGKLYLDTYNPVDVNEWYDAILVVTKEGKDKLKVQAKSGEAYSHVTPKIFTVETGAFFGENTQDIVSLTGSTEGIFHYYGSNKTISMSTSKQAEQDIRFDFEGKKQ